MRILLWTTQTKANLVQPLDSAAMSSRARWRRCSTWRSQSWSMNTLRRRKGTPPFQKDRRDRQSSLELQSRITPSLYSFCRLGHVFSPLTQVWRVRVQGGGDLPLLGEQQQRQGAGHPQQQGVWAGDTPGDLLVSVWWWNVLCVDIITDPSVFRVTSTLRCNRDCSCEQKYKWHRLLSYDPNNDCAGIFMDWFLFPSCCVCRSIIHLTY